MTQLDPKTKPLLDLIAALEEPPLRQQTPAEFRERRRRGRDLINEPPPDVTIAEDIEIAGAAGPLAARLYDHTAEQDRPTLIYFHGGGFVYGDIESHDPICRRLAHYGRFRVISAEYRLAPENPFPAAIDDALSAVRSVASDPTAFGVDARRLAVGGDSAGACLATVAARHFAHTGEASIAYQLLFYPVTQSGRSTPSREKYADGYFLTKESIDWFDECYLRCVENRDDERISPLRTPPPSNLAPALIYTAGFDPLLDEGAAYAKSLENAGIKILYKEYPDQIHGFLSFTKFSSVADDALRNAAHVLTAALR